MLSNILYKISKIETDINPYTNEKEVRYYTGNSVIIFYVANKIEEYYYRVKYYA